MGSPWRDPVIPPVHLVSDVTGFGAVKGSDIAAHAGFRSDPQGHHYAAQGGRLTIESPRRHFYTYR
jgi:hypothetical protein